MWAGIKSQNPGAHYTGAMGQDLGTPGHRVVKNKSMTDFHPLIHVHIKRVLSDD